MDLVMFAIIGTNLSLDAGYWICFGFAVLFRLIKAIRYASE